MNGLLFLDFDGVLLTPAYQLEHGGGRLEPEKVRLLVQIVKSTGARIVVSSSWRGSLTSMRQVLAEAGLKNVRRHVAGVTPRLHALARGREIAKWLDKHYPTTRPPFCILDDSDDMDELLDRLVQTDSYEGLTDRHIGLVQQMLAT